MPINVRDTFPLTHEQGVKILLDADWSRTERTQLLRTSMAELHQGVGLALRLHWFLSEKTSPMARHYQKRFGLGHADDMSHLILRDFKAGLHRERFCVESEVMWLKKHWTDQGVDPLTLERMP